MTTPAQTPDNTESLPLRAVRAMVVVDDGKFTLGPLRLAVNEGKDGERSYTVYSRRVGQVPVDRPELHCATDSHRFKTASAIQDRAQAIAAMMRIAAVTDPDVGEALDINVDERTRAMRSSLVHLVRDNVEDLPEGVTAVEAVQVAMEVLSGLRAQLAERAQPFTHLHATPEEAESFISEVSYLFGYDSDGRYTDLPALLEQVTAARDTLQGLRDALKVGPNSFTPAQLVGEVRLMRVHDDERDAKAKALRDAYISTSTERDKALADLRLAKLATEQAEQERDDALARLREFARAEAAHDNAADFHDRRTRAIHAALCMVAFNESQSEPARLVMSWLAGQVAPPDEYVGEAIERALHLLGQEGGPNERRARSAISELRTEAGLLIQARKAAPQAAK